MTDPTSSFPLSLNDSLYESKRQCGSCTLCCKLLAVPAIEKPAGKWCQYCERSKGCGIYDVRPAGCRTFNCMWLQGAWLDSDRPDQIHVVFGINETPQPLREKLAREKKQFTDAMVTAFENRPGAFQTTRARELIMTLRARDLVVGLVYADGRRSYFVPDVIEEIVETP